MNSGSDDVKEGKKFDFDLNIEPVDVEVVDEENCDSSDNSNSCSICLEPVVNTNNDHRTIVTLECDHQFHLDCIGSYFNAMNSMQCPNCRNVEPGQWQVGNGHFNCGEDDEINSYSVNDIGFFTDMIVKSELCHYGHTSQNNDVRGQHCVYAECYFFSCISDTERPDRSDISRFVNIHTRESPDPDPIPLQFENLFYFLRTFSLFRHIPLVRTERSSISNTHTREVPNPNPFELEDLLYHLRPYPLFPHIPLPSDRRIFWSAVRPGVRRARHYICHPFYNHGSFSRSDASNDNPSMGLSYARSYTRQFNLYPSLLGKESAQIYNLWGSEPFMEPAQQNMVESKFFRIIYGDDGSNNNGEGNSNRGESSSRGGHRSNGSSGNGDNNGVSGRS